MAWIAANAATIVVLLAVVAVVALIIRGFVRNRGLGCDGCSSDCAGCKGACPTKPIELTDEQRARLAELASRGGTGR